MGVCVLWGLGGCCWRMIEYCGMDTFGVLWAVEVLGPMLIRGLVGRCGGGGKDALKVGSRFLTPPVAALRKLPALFLMPGEAVLDMDVLCWGTGESMIEPGAGAARPT